MQVLSILSFLAGLMLALGPLVTGVTYVDVIGFAIGGGIILMLLSIGLWPSVGTYQRKHGLEWQPSPEQVRRDHRRAGGIAAAAGSVIALVLLFPAHIMAILMILFLGSVAIIILTIPLTFMWALVTRAKDPYRHQQMPRYRRRTGERLAHDKPAPERKAPARPRIKHDIYRWRV